MFDIFDAVEPEKKIKVKPKKIITYSDVKKKEPKTTIPETPGETFANFASLAETVSENTEPTTTTEEEDSSEEETENEEEQPTQEFLEENEDVPLNFLENPETGHVFIGRKPSVLQKYGEEASLYLGKVKEDGYPEKEVYFDSLDPQTVFVCGGKGSGKCLVGDTEILTSDGSLVKIKDLKENKEIIGLNEHFKLLKTKKEGFYKRTANKILEITLNSGNKLTLTPEHPLFTITGWKPAKELKLKGKIAIPRVLPFFGKEQIKDCKIKLLAYMIAEGHLGNHFALFSNSDNEILEEFKKAVKELDSNLRIDVHSKEGCYRVSQIKKKVNTSEIKRNGLGQFTNESKIHCIKNSLIQHFVDIGLYGLKSKEKYVPDFVFKLRKEFIKIFLNRLFSCDGSIYYTNCWEASYSSSSEKLIKQVQHLLIRFGVYSKLRTKKIKYKGQYVISYELVIDGEFVSQYIKEIGFFGKKAEISKRALKEMSKIVRNPNLDTIPKEVFSLVKVDNWAELGRKIGYKSPKSIISSKKNNVGREKLRKIGNALKNKFLQELADSDLYWDTIVNIKKINKKTDVYDISVPKCHNFVANNIIVHNSYFLGVIAEELALKNKNVGQIVIDPVGVFWSMKHPNKDPGEVSSLADYGLEPKGLENVIVFIPEGAKEKMPRETYDTTITLQPSFLTPEDWALTFGIDRFSPSGLLLEKVVKKVEEGYRTLDGIIFKPKKNNYDLNDIIYCLEQDVELNSKEKGYRKDSIRALVSRFEAAKTWGLFSKKGTPLIELAVPGQLTIIDTSFLDETVSALLVGILARRILSARKMSTRKEASQKMHDTKTTVDMENDIPPTWLFIDEAHTLVPSGSLATPASKSIIEYVKQGRKPGCSLILATQQPSAIDSRVLSQVGTLVTYKLMFDDDIRAVFKRMPTVVPRRFKDPSFIKRLSVGVPLMADRVETTSRAFVMNIRPRTSHHEGRETQTAEISHNLTLEEVLETMCDITKNKIKQFEELDEHSLKTLLKILNMKYKTEITFEKFAEKLMNSDVIFDKDKYFMEKDSETEKYEERLTYNVIDADFAEEEIIGLAKRATGWQNLDVKSVYRPIFKVNYKVYNEEGSSFVNHFCYIDPLKVEFLHLVNNEFVYSAGLCDLRLLEADDIRILLSLPKRQGFDMEHLKENSTFGDVKLKNTMDRLISMGLLRKEKRGTKNVYFMIKNLEIPTKSTNKLLTSLGTLSLSAEDVAKENILETRANYETIRSILGTLWGEIRIEDIETILRQDFVITNNETKDIVIFDSYQGKQVK